jgi:hypothetical protein
VAAVDEPAGPPVRARLAFQPLSEGDSGSLDRLAPGPAGCLPGGLSRPHTMPPGGRGPRSRCPRASRGPPHRPPCPFAAYSNQRAGPRVLHSHRGRYHTDRQPGAALQNTAICPAAPSRQTGSRLETRPARAGHDGMDHPQRPRLYDRAHPLSELRRSPLPRSSSSGHGSPSARGNLSVRGSPSARARTPRLAEFHQTGHGLGQQRASGLQ